MAKYEWLAQPDVLTYIDNLQFKTQYIKMVILDQFDRPLENIEGRATGGNININGSSAVRRTGSLSLVTQAIERGEKASALDNLNKVTDIKNLISLNKRCSIEVGIKNSGLKYPEYDMFWFPLGTFTITNANVQDSNNGISISVNLKDKMTLLNGELGGVIQQGIIHSPVGIGETSNGELITESAKVNTIIQTLLLDFGEVDADKIIIEDISNQIKTVARWLQEEKLYAYKPDNKPKYALENRQGGIEVPTYGYVQVMTDFTYPAKEFSSNAGESVTSALDKVKNTLGNHEYFYDLDGIFHFQQIKNFLNEGATEEDLAKSLMRNYYLELAGDKAVYHFDDGVLITSYNNNPQFNLVKNDFTVWGKMPDSEQPIRYHLIVDDLSWVETEKEENRIKNWRIQEYEKALTKQGNNQRLTAFEKEILENVPKVWDTDTGELLNEDTSQLTYWLDVIDTHVYEDMTEKPPVAGFGISEIGRRPKVINDNDVNCLFATHINETTAKYVFYNAENYYTGETKPSSDSDWENALIQGDNFANYPTDGYLVTPSTFKKFSIGTIENSAFERLRSELHQSLSWNNSISIQTMPIYHLDVNQRISVWHEEADITGDYIINSISIPLALNGMMTINAQKAKSRI